MSSLPEDKLRTFLTLNYPDKPNISIDRVDNISDGWESEMYCFSLSHGPSNSRKMEQLALRIYPGDNAIEKSQRESEAMKLLFDSGYPVPKIYALDNSLTYLDRPFVLMEWIDGRVMWSLLDGRSNTRQVNLINLFASLFVDLHNLDWRSFTSEEFDQQSEDVYRYIDAWFAKARLALEQYKVIDLDPVLQWLEPKRERLACMKPSAVHQDFHPANILVQDDGSAVVIDWTGFDVSDYRFDLAWSLVLINAYSGQDLRESVLREYESRIGGPVAEIETFEVFACTRRLFDVFVSLSDGAQRLGMRAEAVEVIRQQMPAVANVYQMLLAHTGIRLKDVEELIQSES